MGFRINELLVCLHLYNGRDTVHAWGTEKNDAGNSSKKANAQNAPNRATAFLKHCALLVLQSLQRLSAHITDALRKRLLMLMGEESVPAAANRALNFCPSTTLKVVVLNTEKNFVEAMVIAEAGESVFICGSNAITIHQDSASFAETVTVLMANSATVHMSENV